MLALLTISLVLIAIACGRQARSKSQASNQTAASDPTIEVSSAGDDSSSDDPCPQMFSSFFVEADSLAYNDYEVVKLHKVERDKPSDMDVEVAYVVLKSKGKVIATFDDVHYPAGNTADFGFASLLGGETKQLVISETLPRGGRHWIVDVSSDGATLFDSYDWDLGREDVCVHDFDGDGIAELSMLLTTFWGFGAMSMADSPMPGVIFKYDSASRRFLPDKNAFARGLANIEEDVKTIDPNERPRDGYKGQYLAVRLDIFLRYVYAGRESDAWSFLERAYSLEDKREVEKKIRAILDREPVYKFVHGKSRGRS
jgi:hypothetical protein